MQRAFFQLHLAIFLAGFTGILGRLITLNEGWLVWYRLFISTLALWLIGMFSRKLRQVTTADRLKMALIGLLIGVHWMAFYASIKYANVSIALVCFSAVGFFTSIFEPIILRKRFVLAEVLLGLMVIAGIYIIFHFDLRYKTGILLGLFCALLGALFPIYNRQFMQKMNAETLITWEMTGGFLGVTILMPIFNYFFPSEYWFPNLEDWMWLLVLAFFCTVWAFQFSSNALKKLSAFTVNLSYNLEPVYGIILAFIVYKENEQLDYSFYIGIAIIAAAVLLQTWRVWLRRKG